MISYVQIKIVLSKYLKNQTPTLTQEPSVVKREATPDLSGTSSRQEIYLFIFLVLFDIPPDFFTCPQPPPKNILAMEEIVMVKQVLVLWTDMWSYQGFEWDLFKRS
eukprot:TRINITY_DN36408_c0_g1_i1.p1 TRINITY_DN36408_c0_g1~~TRINITY_DN36408_c0_g1_i1.p1  ORF type:complete len:106 (-),score=15.38 TRINITY_DN36408_c0_g1_i1:82-399(-)